MKALPFEILRETDTGEVDERNHPILVFKSVQTVNGYLDMITGSDEQTYQNSLLDSSQQVFITDGMPAEEILTTDSIKNPRTGQEFEITFVDDIMEQGDHLEIYCKRWT